MPTDRECRQQFDELGYTVFENVLTPEEVRRGVEVFDRHFTPDTQPPFVTGDANNRNGRKQLNSTHCIPELANVAGHPGVLRSAAALFGRPFRLTHTSIPCVTFKSPPGGERFDLGYHVDWPHSPPEPGDGLRINGLVHFSTVEPGGGAFMVCPGSHRLIQRLLASTSPGEAALRERALKQQFLDFPGLSEPQEMCAPAGSVLFYHAYLVHDRSENLCDQPRKVVFVHYKAWEGDEERQRVRAAGEKAFHPEYVQTMDARIRDLCGI